jgi:hypothetical protein
MEKNPLSDEKLEKLKNDQLFSSPASTQTDFDLKKKSRKFQNF